MAGPAGATTLLLPSAAFAKPSASRNGKARSFWELRAAVRPRDRCTELVVAVMPLLHAIVLAIIFAPVAAIAIAVGVALLQRMTAPGKAPAEPDNRRLWVWGMLLCLSAVALLCLQWLAR
jgi:hypothetical protein